MDKKLSPAEMADVSIRERLFGTFPYAKYPSGTPITLSRVERADLMLARDRFLSPNNATLVIIGGVDEKRAMRALRQLLGGWRKSEELVPASFRQPAPVDNRILVADLPGASTAEVRLAVRGLARGDRDYAAATLLASIARDRWQKQLNGSAVSVKHEAHSLPGIFLMGTAVETANANKTLDMARAVLKSLVDSPPSPAELEQARREYLAADSKLSADEKLANDWLNMESYSLPSFNEQLRAVNGLTATELQRVAARLFNNNAVASVVVGDATVLKAQIPAANVEILGDAKAKAAEPAATSTPSPVKHRPFIFTPKTTNPIVKSQKPTPQPD
jgi:predicted Zn-dependent peptidase